MRLSQTTLKAMSARVLTNRAFFQCLIWMRTPRSTTLTVDASTQKLVLSVKFENSNHHDGGDLSTALKIETVDGLFKAQCSCSERNPGVDCLHIQYLAFSIWAALDGHFEFGLLDSATIERIKELSQTITQAFPEARGLKSETGDRAEREGEWAAGQGLSTLMSDSSDPRDSGHSGDGQDDKQSQCHCEKILICINSHFFESPLFDSSEFRDPHRQKIASTPKSLLSRAVIGDSYQIPFQLARSPNDQERWEREQLTPYFNFIEYVFSDGTRLKLNEILYHPYAKTLPRNLLPLKNRVFEKSEWAEGELKERAESMSDQLFRRERPDYFEPQRELKEIILRILLNASKLGSTLGSTISLELDAVALKIDRVESFRATDERETARYRWVLESTQEPGVYNRGRLVFKKPKSDLENDCTVYPWFELDRSQSQTVLRFVPYHDWLELPPMAQSQEVVELDPDFDDDDYDTDLGYDDDGIPIAPTPRRNQKSDKKLSHTNLPERPFEKPRRLEIKLEGSERVASLVSELNEWFDNRAYPPVSVSPAEVIHCRPSVSADKVAGVVKPEVWLKSDGTFQFSVQMRLFEKSVRVWNLPASISLTVVILNLGLGAAAEVSATSLATDRRGDKRKRDLKVLRHTGLAAVFVNSIFKVITELNRSCELFIEQGLSQNLAQCLSKEALKTKFAEVLKTLSDAIVANGLYEFETHHKPTTESGSIKFEKLCSDGVRNYLFGVFSSLVKIHTAHHLTGAANTHDHVDGILALAPSGVARVKGLEWLSLRLIKSMLDASIVSSKGALLTKAKTAWFDGFYNPSKLIDPVDLPDLWFEEQPEIERAQASIEKESSLKSPFEKLPTQKSDEKFHESHLKRLSYQSSNETRSSADVLRELLPLVEDGFTVYWNGKPLLDTDENDFQSEVTVDETKLDWFELHPKVFFKGVELDPSELKNLSGDGILSFQNRFYLVNKKSLPTVKRLEEFWQVIQGNAQSVSGDKAASRVYQLAKSKTLDLLGLRAAGTQIDGGPEWQALCAFYDQLSSEREFDRLPDTTTVELKPYQKVGVQWLIDLHRLKLGGILADDMGLGKTVQTLVFLEKLRCDGTLKTALIVVPTSLTYNWKSEAEKFVPELPVEIFQSGAKGLHDLRGFVDLATGAEKRSLESKTLIVTYGLFVNHAELFSKIVWDVLIYDEAQNLKNITAKRTTEARKVNSKFKLCLTGTPLENHLGELYSLLDLTVPGCMGEYSKFRQEYVPSAKSEQVTSPESIALLRRKIRPIVLRRTKRQILSELPIKSESRVEIMFEAKQKKLYRDIALSWNSKVRDSIGEYGEASSQIMMLTALLRLRQACSDPSGLPGVQYAAVSPKLVTLTESLAELVESGESALVFTQFIHTLKRCASECARLGIAHFVIQGSTPRKEREKILKQFGDSTTGAVLIMTLKTGGVGLNLTKASYVFHIDPWWNPAVENQATDRAHRIGQTKPVQVFRYLMKDSVEEKIEKLKTFKQAQFDLVFSEVESDKDFTGQTLEKSAGKNFLSQKDFEFLLS